jgi:hypothetical protein
MPINPTDPTAEADQTPTFGDGKPAPPTMSREMVELQRAASKIALSVRLKSGEDFRLNIEADIAPTLARLVFHYKHHTLLRKHAGAVEVDLTPGYPIDDLDWLDGIADGVTELMKAGESDLVIPRVLTYVRYTNQSGETVYEEGRPSS